MGLASALPIYFQACVSSGCNTAFILSQPPASCKAMMTNGDKPNTIKKNCNTSLYTALVNPPRKVYTITIPADTQMEISKSQCRIDSMSLANAYKEMPDEKTVITAKEIAFKPLVFSSKRNFRYSGTLRARLP